MNLLLGLLLCAASPAAGQSPGFQPFALAAEPGTGEFLAAWSDTGSEEAADAPDLQIRRMSAASGALGPVVSLPAPGAPAQPELAYHPPTRQFLLAWTDRREFAGAAGLALARVLDAAGGPASDEFDLAADAHAPVLAAPERGAILAGWTDLARGGMQAAWIDPTAPPAPQPRVLDERPFTADPARLAAAWSVVGFPGGLREYRTAVGSLPGADDIAPWAAREPSAEAIVTGAREGLRLEEGRTYYFSVVVVGRDGRQSRVGTSAGSLVDRTGPRVAITGAPPASLRDTVALVTFEAVDNLAPASLLRYRWRLDGGPWSLPSGSRTARLEGLTPGPHQFEVEAIDPAENTGPAVATAFVVLR
jgi:hypothetical protein